MGPGGQHGPGRWGAGRRTQISAGDGCLSSMDPAQPLSSAATRDETSTFFSWRLSLGAPTQPGCHGLRLAGDPGDGGLAEHMVPAVPTLTPQQPAPASAAAAPRTGPTSREPRATQPHDKKAAPGRRHTASRTDKKRSLTRGLSRDHNARGAFPWPLSRTHLRPHMRRSDAAWPLCTHHLHHHSATNTGAPWFLQGVSTIPGLHPLEPVEASQPM